VAYSGFGFAQRVWGTEVPPLRSHLLGYFALRIPTEKNDRAYVAVLWMF